MLLGQNAPRFPHAHHLAPDHPARPRRAGVAQSVGEKIADATFPDFVNGDGRQKLSDFYGQPIVIDLWGTR